MFEPLRLYCNGFSSEALQQGTSDEYPHDLWREEIYQYFLVGKKKKKKKSTLAGTYFNGRKFAFGYACPVKTQISMPVLAI